MKKTIAMLALSFAVLSVTAQKFAQPFALASVKDASLVMADGTEMKDMRVKQLKAKKNLPIWIKVNSEATGTKKIMVKDIASLTGKPKGLAKISAIGNTSITNAAKTDYGSTGKDGLLYEKVDMPKGAKVKVTLLQLLNPEYCSMIKVYADPLMKTSSSFAGGLVGGELKSFYLKVGDGPVIYVKNKSQYKKKFAEIYASCPNFESEVTGKFGNVNVLDLGKHVLLFEEKCGK